MDVGRSDAGVFWIKLKSDEFAVRRECSREPYGAVSAQRSDFENSFGALHPGEEMKELALGWADVNRWEAGACVCFESVIDALIGWDEVACDVTVDCCPEVLIHNQENRVPLLDEQTARCGFCEWRLIEVLACWYSVAAMRR